MCANTASASSTTWSAPIPARRAARAYRRQATRAPSRYAAWSASRLRPSANSPRPSTQ